MRSLVGVVVGSLLAFAIACGGSSAPTRFTGAPPPGGSSNRRGEIEQLDQAITAEMQKLEEPRPSPPVNACSENCAQPMATQARQATDATQPSATCPAPKTDTCKESCTLKSSICTSASRICTIASELGGNDAYANETCNRGLASCEAATKRCCGCM